MNELRGVSLIRPALSTRDGRCPDTRLYKKLEDNFMARKPTCEELKERITSLEKEAVEQRIKIENSLKVRKEKYRALMDAAGDCITEVSLEGFYIYVNPKATDVLGYLPEEMLGHHITDFMSKEEARRTKSFFMRITEAGIGFSGFVCTHIHKDGHDVVLEINGAPYFDASGKIVGYWVLERNITKRVQAEEALIKSEEKWRSLVENAPNMIIILDRNGKIQFINRTLPFLRAEEVLGTDHLDYVHPEFHLTVKKCTKNVFRTGNPDRYIVKGLGPDGGMSWYETMVGPLKNKDEVFAILLITTDITERIEAEQAMRRAKDETERQVHERTAELLEANKALHAEITERMRVEKSLQESEQRFRSLVEATSDMVWELDINGAYSYVSSKSRDLLGYEPEEIIGVSPFDLFMTEQEKIKAYGFLKGLCAKPMPFPSYVSTVKQKSGRRIIVETRGAPVFDSNGTHIGFRGIDRDITERVRSQENMFQAAKMVSLGTLVSGVAHEINNPITSIMLNSPIIQKIWEDISPALDNYCKKNGDIKVASATYSQLRDRVPVLLSNINEGAKRVKRIVDDLKNFARQNPSNLNEKVNVNDAIKKAVDLVSNLIKHSTSHFSVEYGVGLPRISGNTQRLEQVALNLIINACESLPDKECPVFISTSLDTDSKEIRIIVRDKGEGMKPEILERIGDPFFTTKRDMGGTGLGLAISTKIIKDHGGSIKFESSPGQGTTVIVTFPTGQ
ncbi:putative Histidine kinase [uncultured Desulfobacterium sp.]|uniref:histidine kinase n=1 Tax=uncultured Desulfobacterium sp. TaxID=201089 RepID=A0A445N1F6_9BACT|nr:putative Histidine kinase [uncultured Desulfobacterium sp.]